MQEKITDLFGNDDTDANACREKGSAMKTYRVYIRQVNQTYIDVKARTIEGAEGKACREWLKQNGPSVMSVVEFEEEQP